MNKRALIIIIFWVLLVGAVCLWENKRTKKEPAVQTLTVGLYLSTQTFRNPTHLKIRSNGVEFLTDDGRRVYLISPCYWIVYTDPRAPE